MLLLISFVIMSLLLIICHLTVWRNISLSICFLSFSFILGFSFLWFCLDISLAYVNCLISVKLIDFRWFLSIVTLILCKTKLTSLIILLDFSCFLILSDNDHWFKEFLWQLSASRYFYIYVSISSPCFLPFDVTSQTLGLRTIL